MKEPKRPDLDGPLLKGCLNFAFISLGLFLWSTAPFLLRLESYQQAVLLPNLAVGFLPAFGLAALLVRRFGTTAAGALIAGSLTFGVFFFLRHWPFAMTANTPNQPTLDYPHAVVWALPLFLAFLSVSVASLMMPKTDPAAR